MLTAILLASGFSRRFQEDKLLMDFHGKPIIEHTVQTIAACPFDQKLLIQRTDKYTRLAQQYGFRSIHNPDALAGQSQSIKQGVLHSACTSACMFFVADQPLMSTTIIMHLIEHHQQHPEDIIVPKVKDSFFNPVLFPASLRPALSSITGDIGGKQVLKLYPERVRPILFDDPCPFADIDTLEDYHNLLDL